MSGPWCSQLLAIQAVDVDVEATRERTVTYDALPLRRWRGQLTPSKSSPSSRWRGITVTSSISQRKATSGGVNPGGSGNAIVLRPLVECREDALMQNA